MGYQRSRSIPPSNSGAIAAADATEGSTRRGRSKSLRLGGTGSPHSRAASVERLSLRRRGSSFVGLEKDERAPRRERSARGRRISGRSVSPSAARGCRSAHTRMTHRLADFDARDCAPVAPALKRSSTSECKSSMTSSSSSSALPSLRRSKTDTVPKSVLKASKSLPAITRRPSKASLGIMAIASGVISDEKGSPNLVKGVRRTPKRQVSFDADNIMSTSQHKSASTAKSSMEESLRRMKSLQQKFRRSSQEQVSITVAEQARLAKEVPLLEKVPSLPTSIIRNETKKTNKPTPGKGKSAAAMSA